MYFFPLASKTPPFPLLCTLYNSLMTLSGDLVGWALCAACEKRLPKITTKEINEKLIVLIVSVPQKFAILRKHITLRLSGSTQLNKEVRSWRVRSKRLFGCGIISQAIRISNESQRNSHHHFCLRCNKC